MVDKAVSCTDIGTRKEVNQDSLYVAIANTEQGSMVLAVMCDGLGGLSYGEVASSKTVSMYKEWFQNQMPDIMENGFDWEIIKEHWSNLIYSANSLIKHMGDEHKTSIGTTLTAALFYNNRYLIAQVGDSRCYEINSSLIMQLTKDQTLVARELSMGLITKEQALVDSRKHVLLQCIGSSEDIDAQLTQGIIKENANYMLCSDGFYKKLEEKELQQNLGYYPGQNKQKIDVTVKKMIETCKQRGEKDNISCIVLFT